MYLSKNALPIDNFHVAVYSFGEYAMITPLNMKVPIAENKMLVIPSNDKGQNIINYILFSRKNMIVSLVSKLMGKLILLPCGTVVEIDHRFSREQNVSTKKCY